MPKKNDRVILVTGATGQQGGAALRHLRDKGFSVRALTRDPENPEARALVGHGTEVVRGDLNDTASLTRALDGVYGVYSVQALGPEGVESEVRQGLQLADAAKRSRISHFVYSSVAGSDRKTGIPYFESKFRIEEHLRGTGLHYTILRPVFFMENWLRMQETIRQGALALPVRPETTVSMIAVDDIGAFVALALEKPGHWQGRAVELAGDELPMTALAQAFGRMAGREVQYRQIPWEEFERGAGPDLTRMWRWFEESGNHVDSAALRQEHPGLMSFERWLQSRWPRYSTA